MLTSRKRKLPKHCLFFTLILLGVLSFVVGTACAAFASSTAAPALINAAGGTTSSCITMLSQPWLSCSLAYPQNDDRYGTDGIGVQLTQGVPETQAPPSGNTVYLLSMGVLPRGGDAPPSYDVHFLGTMTFTISSTQPIDTSGRYFVYVRDQDYSSTGLTTWSSATPVSSVASNSMMFSVGPQTQRANHVLFFYVVHLAGPT